MAYSQQIKYVEHADGSMTARLKLTLPDGSMKLFEHTLTPEELHETAVALAGAENPEVGAAAAPLSAAEFAWQSGMADVLKKSVGDRKAMEKWWAGYGADNRQLSRATFAACMAAGPKGSTPKQLATWWRGLSKNTRVKLREKHGGYGGGFIEDALGSVSDVAKVVGPIASSVVKQIPGYGPVIAASIDDAAKFIGDPKKAAIMAMGGFGALQIIDRLAPSGARKQVAATKVLQNAATALAAGAGAAGISPHLAKGASSVLGTAARLASAELANTAGAPKTARRMMDRARESALAAAGSPAVARTLLLTANATRKNVERSATKAPASTDVLAKARAGKVRSTRGGKVTAAELARAATQGRVFFVHA